MLFIVKYTHCIEKKRADTHKQYKQAYIYTTTTHTYIDTARRRDQ